MSFKFYFATVCVRIKNPLYGINALQHHTLYMHLYHRYFVIMYEVLCFHYNYVGAKQWPGSLWISYICLIVVKVMV